MPRLPRGLISDMQQDQTTTIALALELAIERLAHNLTLYKLDEIIQGELNQVVNPLVQEHQAEQLTSLATGEF